MAGNVRRECRPVVRPRSSCPRPARRELAARETPSRAAPIRRAIALEERRQRAEAAAGRFRSGLADLATRHDDYLAETGASGHDDRLRRPLAVRSADDRFHPAAREDWIRLPDKNTPLHTSDSVALLQRRIGLAAVTVFCDDTLPALQGDGVETTPHPEGVVALPAAGRRGISLVDWVSFRLMRRRGIPHGLESRMVV